MGFIRNLTNATLSFLELLSCISSLPKKVSACFVSVYIIIPIQRRSHEAHTDCLCCLHSIKNSLTVLLHPFPSTWRDETCWIQMEPEPNKRRARMSLHISPLLQPKPVSVSLLSTATPGDSCNTPSSTQTKTSRLGFTTSCGRLSVQSADKKRWSRTLVRDKEVREAGMLIVHSTKI